MGDFGVNALTNRLGQLGLLEFDACFPDSVVGFVADDGPEAASYVELFVRTARADLKRFAPATAQANINLEVLSEVAVPVPPEAEMLLLVARVDEAMARAVRTEAHLAVVADQLAEFDRAILAKAFRGELVPQDPTESAHDGEATEDGGRAESGSGQSTKGRTKKNKQKNELRID